MHHPNQGDPVESVVALTISTSIEAVASYLAARCFHRRSATKSRKSPVAAEPIRVFLSNNEQPGLSLNGDTVLLEQARSRHGNQLGDLPIELGNLFVQPLMTFGKQAQCVLRC